VLLGPNAVLFLPFVLLQPGAENTSRFSGFLNSFSETIDLTTPEPALNDGPTEMNYFPLSILGFYPSFAIITAAASQSFAPYTLYGRMKLNLDFVLLHTLLKVLFIFPSELTIFLEIELSSISFCIADLIMSRDVKFSNLIFFPLMNTQSSSSSIATYL
jgi:hypothetical protein